MSVVPAGRDGNVYEMGKGMFLEVVMHQLRAFLDQNIDFFSSRLVSSVKLLGPVSQKVPKYFGPFSGATIPFISSLCSLTTGFSSPKSSQYLRETGPWPQLFSWTFLRDFLN